MYGFFYITSNWYIISALTTSSHLCTYTLCCVYLQYFIRSINQSINKCFLDKWYVGYDLTFTYQVHYTELLRTLAKRTEHMHNRLLRNMLDNHSDHLRSISAEYEAIAEKLLTAPVDTAELMELIGIGVVRSDYWDLVSLLLQKETCFRRISDSKKRMMKTWIREENR